MSIGYVGKVVASIRATSVHQYCIQSICQVWVLSFRVEGLLFVLKLGLLFFERWLLDCAYFSSCCPVPVFNETCHAKEHIVVEINLLFFFYFFNLLVEFILVSFK
jgi:hypothetical protein